MKAFQVKSMCRSQTYQIFGLLRCEFEASKVRDCVPRFAKPKWDWGLDLLLPGCQSQTQSHVLPNTSCDKVASCPAAEEYCSQSYMSWKGEMSSSSISDGASKESLLLVLLQVKKQAIVCCLLQEIFCMQPFSFICSEMAQTSLFLMCKFYWCRNFQSIEFFFIFIFLNTSG